MKRGLANDDAVNEVETALRGSREVSEDMETNLRRTQGTKDIGISEDMETNLRRSQSAIEGIERSLMDGQRHA